MDRVDYSKIINWKGTATRVICFNEEQEFEIGARMNFGLSWTDGGEFTPETYAKYQYIIEISEETEGHAVDYDNEEETDDIGATDCSREKEILINKDFEIVSFYEFDEEMGFGKVIVK